MVIQFVPNNEKWLKVDYSKTFLCTIYRVYLTLSCVAGVFEGKKL